MAMDFTAPGTAMPEPDYSNRAIGGGVAGLQCGEAMSTKQATDTMRSQYLLLTPYNAARVSIIKAIGAAFLAALEMNPMPHPGREVALAKTKIEEAVMWAVKGITG